MNITDLIKSAGASSLASLLGIDGVSQAMLDAALTNIAAQVSTQAQPELDRIQTLEEENASLQGQLDTANDAASASAEKALFEASGVSEKAIPLFKIAIGEDKLKAVKDAKELIPLLTAAAKASDGALSYNAPTGKGVVKNTTSSASPFDKLIEDEDKDDQDDLQDTEISENLG